jgi:hypothetical protein
MMPRRKKISFDFSKSVEKGEVRKWKKKEMEENALGSILITLENASSACSRLP